MRLVVLAGLLLVGCSSPPPAAGPLTASDVPADAPTPPPPAPRPAPTPLGFDDFSVSPTGPVDWADRFVASAQLMPGVAPGTDVTYRWFVDGREVRAWRREFLRHREGKWRKGELVEVYAVARDGSGRESRTESLGVWVGRRAEVEPPPPPIDWDARRAADDRMREERRRRDEPEAARPEPPAEPIRTGYYVNPSFGGPVFDPALLPQPRRGITTGPDQRVDGYSPGEPRVDGYTPGELRVDGYSPGEPRVGRR